MKSNIISGTGFVQIASEKEPLKLSKTIKKLKSNKHKINWGKLLVTDMSFFIDLL